MRNIVLSAFPRNMRLPDPSTPNLKIDMLAEMGQPPRILSEVDAALKAKQIKADLDEYLKTRQQQASTFLMEMKQRLVLSQSEANRTGTRYNVPLMNSLVLYVGNQVAALEEQQKDTEENNVDDESKSDETDTEAAEPTSKSDSQNETPDINDIPMEENQDALSERLASQSPPLTGEGDSSTSDVDHTKLFLDIEGVNKKKKVYGLGSAAVAYVDTAGSKVIANSSSSMSQQNEEEVDRLVQQNNQMSDKVAELEAQVVEQNKHLAESEKRMSEKMNELAEHNKQMAEQMAELMKKMIPTPAPAP